MLTVGDKFPEFNLDACVSIEKGKEFGKVSSSDHPGKWKIVYLYPKDFTFICPTEIVAFDNKRRDFADREAILIGGSTDNEFSHLAWRNSHKDLHGIHHPLAFFTPAFAQELGVLHKSAGAALRATFIVDPDGIIRSVTVNDLDQGRNVDETLRILDALQTNELCPCDWKKGEKTLSAA